MFDYNLKHKVKNFVQFHANFPFFIKEFYYFCFRKIGKKPFISIMLQIIYYAIITILIVDFGLERILGYLNIKNSSNPVPSILANIYDHEKYKQQQRYFRVNSKFGILTSTFGFLISFVMFAAGGFGWLDQVVASFTLNQTLQPLFFFAILFFANDLLTTPFEIYDIFVIEQKFEFNKVTPKIFILDKLKGYLLTIVVGGGILFAIISIYQYTAEYFWLIAWAVVTAFSLFMSLFYSEIIVPLFNKQTPLPDGELRDEIQLFANKVGFKLNNIFVIDGSKRSTKANAYFTGFGPKKRIVLYDTLMDKLTTQEIVAVLAHEIGHYKHKHTLKNMLVSLPISLFMFYILGLLLSSNILALAMGGTAANFHLNVLAFGLLYTPLSLLLNLFTNRLSQKYEYQADSFTVQHHLGDNLIAGLKKLSATSLSNLTPHPLYVFFYYSHPTLYQRISNINSVKIC